MRVNGQHKYFRIRQTHRMWYGFYQIPNPYGEGWIPIKSAGVHERDTKIPCLYRTEHEDKHKYKLRKRKENRTKWQYQ